MTGGEWWLFCQDFERGYQAMTWAERGLWLMVGALGVCLIMFMAGVILSRNTA